MATKASDPADPLIGDRLMGAGLHFLGKQTRRAATAERMLERYVAPPNRSDVVRFQFDQRVVVQTVAGRGYRFAGAVHDAPRRVRLRRLG